MWHFREGVIKIYVLSALSQRRVFFVVICFVLVLVFFVFVFVFVFFSVDLGWIPGIIFSII